MKTQLNTTLGSFDAKTHFSEVLAKVRNGKTFVITWHGEPVAKIVPFEKKKFSDLMGSMPGIKMADDFDAPLEAFKEYMQ